MTITIINDCKDGNAKGRQVTRTQALFDAPVSFVGVSNELEASGNLIDTLDALGDTPGVILVNVAPRNGTAKKWKNGTPFGYFWHQKTLVVASIDGLVLSLVKKLQLTGTIHVLDIPTALEHMFDTTQAALKNYISESQFRSYDFLPRVAAFLLEHKKIASTPHSIDTFLDAPKTVWWVDNFGNAKTTLLQNDVEIDKDNLVQTKLGAFPYYTHLKDVPDGETALITGSSGINDKRFLEMVIQGKSAASHFSLTSGDRIC